MTSSLRALHHLIVKPRSRVAGMASAMGALLLVYAAWQLLGWPAGNRSLIGDVFFYPVGLAAVGAAIGASRRCSDRPRLRSAWRLLGLASASYLAGNVVFTLYEVTGGRPYPSVADGFSLLFYPLMLWGLLRFPAGCRNVGERVRLSLDLAVVAIGGSAVVMYVVLGPTIVQSGSDSLETAFSIAYPVGDLVLLVGVATVLLRRIDGSSARALRLMTGGLLLYVAADLVYGYVTLHSTYHGGDPIDSLWMIAIALFAVAGAAQGSSDPSADLARTNDRPRASWAPYIALALSF